MNLGETHRPILLAGWLAGLEGKGARGATRKFKKKEKKKGKSQTSRFPTQGKESKDQLFPGSVIGETGALVGDAPTRTG